MEVWGAVDNERSVLTDDLSRLNERQWDVQSLCTEWKIRHVVAHLVIEANVKLGATLVGVVKNGMNVNRALAQAALTAGIAPPDVLLLRFKDTIGSRTILPFTKPACVLADVICHAADVRRPLGLSRDVPKSALIAAADFLRSDSITGAKRRIVGLRLSATDSDWVLGDGPKVEGPLEALVLAMAGRADALGELAGDGFPTLQTRTELNLNN
jgi:uncharacterized protein (TIGR03083 family)